MMITIYTSERVSIGSDTYRAAMAKAERIASQQRQVGKGGCVTWDDDYNDYSATGRFRVTARD